MSHTESSIDQNDHISHLEITYRPENFHIDHLGIIWSIWTFKTGVVRNFKSMAMCGDAWNRLAGLVGR